MLILIFALFLLLVGALSVELGDDSRPSVNDHSHNW